MGGCLANSTQTYSQPIPIKDDQLLQLKNGQTSVSLNPLKGNKNIKESKNITVEQIDSWLGENLTEEEDKKRNSYQENQEDQNGDVKESVIRSTFSVCMSDEDNKSRNRKRNCSESMRLSEARDILQAGIDEQNRRDEQNQNIDESRGIQISLILSGKRNTYAMEHAFSKYDSFLQSNYRPRSQNFDLPLSLQSKTFVRKDTSAKGDDNPNPEASVSGRNKMLESQTMAMVDSKGSTLLSSTIQKRPSNSSAILIDGKLSNEEVKVAV